MYDLLGGGLALCAADLRLLAALLLDLLQGGTNDRAVDLRGLTRAVSNSNQGQHRTDQTADKARGGGREGVGSTEQRDLGWRRGCVGGGVERHQPGSLNNRTYYYTYQVLIYGCVYLYLQHAWKGCIYLCTKKKMSRRLSFCFLRTREKQVLSSYF